MKFAGNGRGKQERCGQDNLRHADIYHLLRSCSILLAIICLLLISNTEVLASLDDLYALQIDLPSDILKDVVVSATLSTGLTYDPQSLIVSGASTNPTEVLSPVTDGSTSTDIVWSFGQVDNSADQDIKIQFKVVLADLAANQDETLLSPSSATLQWTYSNGSPQTLSGNFKSIKVIEPDLQIERSFAPSSGWRGDEISCTLDISHSSSSHATAYDVDIQETLPQDLIYVPGSMEIVKGPEGTIGDLAGLSWHFPKVDQSWSGTQMIKLRYKAKISSQVQKEASAKCLATMDWTSTSGENPQERHYTESYESGFMLILNLTNETLSNETLSNETLSNETLSNETLSNETLSNETLSNETLSNETLSNETKTNDAKTNETQFDIISNVSTSNKESITDISSKDSGQVHNQTEEDEPDSRIGDNSESSSEGNASMTNDLQAEPAQLGVSEDEEADDSGSNDTDDIIQVIFDDGIKIDVAFSGSSLGTYSATAKIESEESAVDGVTEYQEDSSENSALPENNSAQSSEQATNQTLEEGNQTADTIAAPAIVEEVDEKADPVDARVEVPPDPQPDLSEPAADQSDTPAISNDEIDPEVELSEAEKVTPEADGGGDS